MIKAFIYTPIETKTILKQMSVKQRDSLTFSLYAVVVSELKTISCLKQFKSELTKPIAYLC